MYVYVCEYMRGCRSVYTHTKKKKISQKSPRINSNPSGKKMKKNKNKKDMNRLFIKERTQEAIRICKLKQ